jgi:hypothetical protein
MVVVVGEGDGRSNSRGRGVRSLCELRRRAPPAWGTGWWCRRIEWYGVVNLMVKADERRHDE